MKAVDLRLLALCSLSLTGACADTGAGPSGPEVAIEVAPLTLPGVVGIEYALAVFNADPVDYTAIFDEAGVVDVSLSGILVWQQGSVTSNQYGNNGGGDISYVGPCDASSADNWVALALKQVEVTSGGSENGIAPFAGTNNILDDQNTAFDPPGINDLDPDFQNPSPYNAALVMKFACNENEDTSVVFNLTVMRDANQGFFDIAVNFEDIFCSMKIDSCYDGDKPIKLLFDRDGNRVETVNIASACTAGPDDNETVMWFAPINVSCDQADFTIDPAGYNTDGDMPEGQPGNHCIDVVTAIGPGTQPAKATGTLEFTENSLGTIGNLAAGTICTVASTNVSFTLNGDALAINAQNGLVLVPVTANAQGDAGNIPAGTNLNVICGQGALYNVHADTSGGSDGGAGEPVTKKVCYALYWGAEDLECGTGISCGKEYWNVSINVDDLRDAGLTNCNVTTSITASSTSDVSPPTFVNGQLQGPGQTYGYVAFDADITDDGAEPTCFQGPMGSDYTPVVYGTTSDILGGKPFPQLCYSMVRGNDPRILKNVSNYFKDLRATEADAIYAGKIRQLSDRFFSTIKLDYLNMGIDVGTKCKSGVYNKVEYIRFDVATARDQINWTGAAEKLGGTYNQAIYGRKSATEGWALLVERSIDLGVGLVQDAFRKGGSFDAFGNTQFLIKFERTDTDYANIYSFRINVTQ